MQTTDEQTMKHRPFHETIVDAIRDVRNGPDNIMGGDFLATLRTECLKVLAKLIKETKIPANHLKIIAIWNWAVEEAGLDEESFGVMTNLLEQRQKAAEKEKEKTGNQS